jgi:hypothetical protein
MPAAWLAGVVELAQGAAERLDLVFVGILLPLGQFERLENFFHLVERLAERLENLIDLFDGLFDRRRRSPLRLEGQGGRGIGPALAGGRPPRGLRRS